MLMLHRRGTRLEGGGGKGKGRGDGRERREGIRGIRYEERERECEEEKGKRERATHPSLNGLRFDVAWLCFALLSVAFASLCMALLASL